MLISNICSFFIVVVRIVQNKMKIIFHIYGLNESIICKDFIPVSINSFYLGLKKHPLFKSSGLGEEEKW